MRSPFLTARSRPSCVNVCNPFDVRILYGALYSPCGSSLLHTMTSLRVISQSLASGSPFELHPLTRMNKVNLRHASAHFLTSAPRLLPTSTASQPPACSDRAQRSKPHEVHIDRLPDINASHYVCPTVPCPALLHSVCCTTGR